MNKNQIIAQQAVLIVLDGWGYREDPTDNAVAAARTPHFDRLWNTFPHTLLEASGEAVGLPEGQMGNSEIGHMTIGAGKAIDTDLVRIKKSIKEKKFVSNDAFTSLFDHVKKHNSTLHVMGLLSDGGVHSHYEHLFAFLRSAKDAGMEKIAIHVFTDGRDTAPQSAGAYLRELEAVLQEIGVGYIASISGRFYAMDRDNNWDRLKKTEEALFDGMAEDVNAHSVVPSELISKMHAEGTLDEHIKPIVFLDEDGKNYPIELNDGIFFFNFRSDRARMLSKNIEEKIAEMNLCFVTMTEYKKESKALIAFPSASIEATIAGEISNAHLTQAHIAETEKFPHATYFLNGGRETLHEGESHELLDSRKDVQTHDLAPKMRAESIADKAIEHIQKGTNFIFINFANADMVGHTANVPAIIEAVEEVDTQLGRVLEALHLNGGVAIVTADHGNAEVNIDPLTKEKHTAHTLNLVPCIITKEDLTLKDKGTLADLAPTTLTLLGVPKPEVMSGNPLYV